MNTIKAKACAAKTAAPVKNRNDLRFMPSPFPACIARNDRDRPVPSG